MKRLWCLRNIPDTFKIKEYVEKAQPKSVVVVGGGYIGIEMAENLHEAGLEVTIVEKAEHVIASIDYDVACDVHNHIRAKGVNLILQDGVNAINESENGLKISLDDSEIYADFVIMAVGVRPESSLAKAAGLDVHPKGGIIVNDRMLTSDENIYAVGDAIQITDFVSNNTGYIPLAGPANKQGRIAADQISGIDSVYKGTQGTGILKCFDLTVSMTGLTEHAVKAQGIDYEKSFTYSASHASYYPGANSMSIKIIFAKDDGKLLGAQIVGRDGVDKRIDVFATAIRAGMTVYDLTELELAYAPPFSSAKDPVNMAGFVAENILKGNVKNFHWHDVADLPKDGSVTFLDIRSAGEYSRGTIEGFNNIPVDSLRDRLDEIDKSKPVYITCQVGLRGYIGARILMQNGYDAYNLSGGYRLYNSILG